MTWDRLSLRDKLAQLSQLPPEKKEEILPELLALHELRDANPLMFFEPFAEQIQHLSQIKGLRGQGPEIPKRVYIGGNRAGKTTIGVVDNLLQCVDRSAVPDHLQQYKLWEPPFYCRIVIPTFGVGEAVIIEKLKEYCPESQLVGDSFTKAYQKVPNKRLRFKNGSYILFNTADQNQEDHAGVRLHRVHFDEEPLGENGRRIYEENRVRLWDFAPQSEMVFTMTPSLGGGGIQWTYDELWERRDEPQVSLITVSALDNPTNPKDIILAEASKWSKEERAARLEGQFVQLGGLVFDRFGDDHIVPPVTRDHIKGQQIFVGIDPGITQGGVIWAAFDKDNHMLVFDELYPRNKTVPDIAAEIKTKNKYWDIEPIYIIDPSGRNRSMTDLENVQGAFYREGIYPIPGQNKREAGIFQLMARIDHKSLLISQECRFLIAEMKRWAKAKDEDTEKFVAKVKGAGGTFATIGADHLIDPVRYVAMQRLYYQPDDKKKRREYAWNEVPPPEPIEPNFIDY